MMQRSPILQTVAAAAVFLSGVPLFAQATLTGKVVSDAILPQDTYLYASVPDVDELQRVIKSSWFGQLLNDPAMAEFNEEFLTAFQGEIGQFQDTFGLTIEEALELPDGEISLAISAAGNSAVGMALFFDVGKNVSRVEPLLDQLALKLSQQPRLQSVDRSYGGTAITGFEILYAGKAPTPLAEEFGWFLKDGRIVASNQMELLESVIDQWDGDSRSSLASNDSYRFIMFRCNTEGSPVVSKFYFNPIGLFTKLVHTGSLGERATMGSGFVLGVLPALGLPQLKAVGGVELEGSGDLSTVLRTVTYAEQPPMGLMQVFQFGQAQTTPPTWVKDNVSMYMATNWQIDEAFVAVESIVDSFQGPGALAGTLDQIAGRGPGIHIRQDIVDNLTGEIQLITVPNSTEKQGGEELLLALGLTNVEAVSALVKRQAGQMNMEVRNFQGTDLYSMDIPGGEAFSLAVKDGRLLFSTGATLMQQVLQNNNDMRPLAESDDYRRVASHFPADAVSVVFSRPARSYRSVYDMVRNGAAENFPGIQDIFEKIDFSKLPPFEKIEKYINPTGSYSVKDDNGYFMESFQLKD